MSAPGSAPSPTAAWTPTPGNRAASFSRWGGSGSTIAMSIASEARRFRLAATVMPAVPPPTIRT